MTKAKTPNNDITSTNGLAKILGSTPGYQRRAFGSRPALYVRNNTRWYYQPRPVPKS